MFLLLVVLHVSVVSSGVVGFLVGSDQGERGGATSTPV